MYVCKDKRVILLMKRDSKGRFVKEHKELNDTATPYLPYAMIHDNPKTMCREFYDNSNRLVFSLPCTDNIINGRLPWGKYNKTPFPSSVINFKKLDFEILELIFECKYVALSEYISNLEDAVSKACNLSEEITRELCKIKGV